MKIKLTVANVAKSLYRQHGFEADVAYLAAWAWLKNSPVDVSIHQALAHMGQVKHIPVLTDDQIANIEISYQKSKTGRG